MSNNLKISVLISIYNHDAKYVKLCLESLKAQTMQDIEFILLDNEAIPESKTLIEEFTNADSRFKVIHIEKNEGYGKALNAGLNAARGAYIGIVESDDFTAPDMYEKLYHQITKFDADVCISGFYIHNNGINYQENLHTRQIFENSTDEKLFSIKDYPFLFTCHQSIWAKLYKSSFIKNIGFSETGCYIDTQFIAELYSRTNKIIALKDFIYYYRADNQNASNSNAKKDKSLIKILDDWEDAKQILKQNDYFNLLKEEYYYHATKPGYRFYKNIDKKYKKEFFKRWQEFVADLKYDNTFTFKYFNPEQKQFILNVLNNNYKATLINNNSLIENIFSIKNTLDRRHKVITILGLKCKIKCHVQTNNAREYYYLQKSNIQASIVHPITFKGYQNKYQNQDIVICGSGPSLKNYKQIKGNIHVGVNRTFLHEDLQLDYLFIQDYLKGKDDMQKANNYNPVSCTKFYGILPEKRYSQTKNALKRISNQDICKANAKPYIIEDSTRRNWANLLEVEAIGDHCGCIFSAFQFVLYTNPKRIYIVGCDCSNNGHFHKERADVYNSSSLEYQKESWLTLKAHVERYYPDTEIISVNPVGLKGLFRDVYTQSYIDEHPELLDEDIEILTQEENKDLVKL